MNNKVEEYINKQRSPQKDVCNYLRNLILKTLPGIKEEMTWGVPVFGGGKFYIGSLRNSVNLGFTISGLSDKEMALFNGRGKSMRHLKYFQVKDIDNKKVARLLKLVSKKSVCDTSC